MIILLGKKPLPNQVGLEDSFLSRAQKEKPMFLLNLSRTTYCYCLSRFNNLIIHLGAWCDLAASTSVPSTLAASPEGSQGPWGRFPCSHLLYIFTLLRQLNPDMVNPIEQATLLAISQIGSYGLHSLHIYFVFLYLLLVKLQQRSPGIKPCSISTDLD